MRDLSDDELMLLTQRGNAHAFELLFERYRVRVFGFILRMLNGRREEAEDLMQDIFIKLFKARELYESRGQFATWLFAIVRNHCLNVTRSRAYLQAQRTVSFEAADETDMAASHPERSHAGNSELADRLEDAIRKLPAMYKDVFLLRAIEGFSHDDTARVLGLPPATVRTHFRRARLLLVKTLGANGHAATAAGGMS